MIFKTTKNILNNPWKENVPTIDSIPKVVPPKIFKTLEKEPTIDEIKLWEQLYYEPGVVGVYASWDPYVDFYMVTYNVFADNELKIKTFYGETAQEDLKNELKKIDIDLPEYSMWVS